MLSPARTNVMSIINLLSNEKLLAEASERFQVQTDKLKKAMHGSASVFNRITRERERNLAYIRSPDVMVLDLKMPGIDGFEVLRRVKREKPATEVIVLTGHSSEAEKQLAMELGAFAYLNKPADINVLAEHMKQAYNKAKTREDN